MKSERRTRSTRESNSSSPILIARLRADLVEGASALADILVEDSAGALVVSANLEAVTVHSTATGVVGATDDEVYIRWFKSRRQYEQLFPAC